MTVSPNLQRVFMATVIAALVIVGLSRGQSILVPVVVGMFAAYLLTAFASWLQGKSRPVFRMPGWLAYAVATAIAALVLWGFVRIIASNLAAVVAAAPGYQANLESVLGRAADALNLPEIRTLADVRDRFTPEISLTALISFAAASISSLASNAAIIGLYALFLVIERGMILRKLLLMARSADERKHFNEILDDIGSRVRTYVLVKTAMSLLVAAVSWLLMSLLGIDFDGFWAVLIFVLNFIPYVGSIIAVIFPAVLALVQFESFGLALGALVLLTAVQFIVGSIIEPRVMGRSLNLSPVIILFTLALWGSIWGVVGAILCVPLTVIIMIGFSRFEATRPLAILLSRDGRLD